MPRIAELNWGKLLGRALFPFLIATPVALVILRTDVATVGLLTLAAGSIVLACKLPELSLLAFVITSLFAHYGEGIDIFADITLNETDLGFVLVLTVFTLRFVLVRRVRFATDPVVIAAGALLLFSLLSAVVGYLDGGHLEAIRRDIRALSYYALVVPFANILTTERARNRSLVFILLGGLAWAGWGLHIIFSARPEGIWVPTYSFGPLQFSRLVYPVVPSSFFVVFFALGSFFIRPALGKRARKALFLCFVVFLITLLFTLTRGMVIAFVAGATAAVLLPTWIQPKNVRWIGVLSLGIAVILVFTVFEIASSRALSARFLNADDPNFKARIGESFEVLRLIGQHPIRGNGLGVLHSFGPYTAYVHNGYLWAWFRLGLGGLLSVLAILFFAIRNCVIAYMKCTARTDRALALSVFASLIATATVSVSNPVLSHRNDIPVILTLLAMSVVLRHTVGQPPSEEGAARMVATKNSPQL